MKFLYKTASYLLLNLIFVSTSAQEFVPPTDSFNGESFQISQPISEGEFPSLNLSENQNSTGYLRAPNSYIYNLDLVEAHQYSGLKIPVKKAFDIWESPDWFLNEALPLGELSAYLFWEDIPGLIEEVEVESASNPENSKIIVKINSNKGKGNAVVSLHLGSHGNSEDPIVWSWHIWVTDNPSSGVSFGQGLETDLNGTPFEPHYMDRNLGAIESEILGDNWHRNAGLLYQWGRKDPIPSMVNKDFSFYELNGLVGYMRNREGIHFGNILPEVNRPYADISDNLKYSVRNPIDYLINEDSGTWFSSQQYRVPHSNPQEVIAWDLWSDNRRGENSNANSSIPEVKEDSRSYELKSPYDPCPNGWRIPSYLGRVTTNNNLSPWGRKNSGGNDDTNPSRNSFYPHTENSAIIDAQVHSGLGIDFTDAYDSNSNSRDIGKFPMTGYYVRYLQNGTARVVYQDEAAIAAIWSATYALGGARYLRVVTDPMRPDIGEFGLNQIMINQTTFSMEALAVRCMKDPNHLHIGDFPTEYISATKEYFTDGLQNPNSYIIQGETELLIPVNKAFSAYEKLFPNEENLPNDQLVANVYWTDNPEMVHSLRLIGEGDSRQKLIRVELNPNQKGNAVVSLHNGSVNNPVYWSWHLWAAADEIQKITYVNQEILPAEYHFVNATGSENPALTTVFMDRNLGALHDLPIEIKEYPELPELLQEVELSGGLHYQWGRKDPIPSFRYVGGKEYEIYKGVSVDSNGIVSYSTLNQLNHQNQFTETYSEYETAFRPNASDDKHKKADKVLQYAVQNPLTYLHHSTTANSDWISDEFALLPERWGHGLDKSIYDPCPEGWRIPDTFRVYENGRGSSPWYNGKKLGSLQGNPQFIGSHYGGSFFHHDHQAIGWFFTDNEYEIGHFPTTGMIGKFSPNSIGGTSINQAITGIWTAALTQQLKGHALAMSIGRIDGSDHKMIATGNTSPAYGLNVRCAIDRPRYEGYVGEDYFNLSIRDFSQNAKENFKIFPNPVKDILNVSSKLNLRIEIYNLEGRLIRKEIFQNSKVNLSDLQKGVYIGLIYENGKNEFTTVKIIKE